MKMFELLKRFWFLKPRLIVADKFTAAKFKWVFKESLKGLEYRSWDQSMYRKYVHMLDKGLQNPDREKGRATEIYANAKRFSGGVSASQSDDLFWADNVLNTYDDFQNGKDISDSVDLPFAEPQLSLAQFSDFAKSRRSIRYFTDKVPTSDLLESVLSLVNWAPHSCNRQNTKIYYTLNKEKIKECLSLNSGATCLNLPPVFITMCSDTSSYYLPLETLAPYIDASLGGQTMMLGAHAAGMAGCVLNWTHASPKQESALRELMGIAESELIIFNYILGYPAKGAPTPARKNSEFTFKEVK